MAECFPAEKYSATLLLYTLTEAVAPVAVAIRWIYIVISVTKFTPFFSFLGGLRVELELDNLESVASIAQCL